MTQNKSDVYSVLRIFLPLIVLIGHVAVMYTPNGAVIPKTGSSFLCNTAYYIYSFHMPAFISLSGALWNYQVERGKYTKALSFIKNKTARLLIPYLFFGICITAPVMVCFNFTKQGFFKYILYGIILSQNSRHLWYVLALFWIFVLSALLRPIWRKLSPFIVLPLSLAVTIASNYLPSSVFQIQAAMYYQFFFLLGAYIDRYWHDLFALLKKVPFFPFLAPFLLLLRFLLPYNTVTLLFYNLTGIFMLFAVPAVLSLRKILNNPFLRTIERDGFGIYLFHPMINYIIFYFLAPSGMAPWLLFLLACVFCFASSLAFTEIIKKCKLGILIGE